MKNKKSIKEIDNHETHELTKLIDVNTKITKLINHLLKDEELSLKEAKELAFDVWKYICKNMEEKDVYDVNIIQYHSRHAFISNDSFPSSEGYKMFNCYNLSFINFLQIIAESSDYEPYCALAVRDDFQELTISFDRQEEAS